MSHTNFRALSLAAASAFAMIGAPAPAQAQAQTVSFEATELQFNIPAQSLASALTEFSRQSQVAVLVPSALVRGRQSVAITGAMTPSEALAQLSAGSGLRVQQTPQGGLTLIQDQAPSPTRVGAADQAASSEEIFVTAQKREERLQDVPLSVSVLTQQTIERRHLVGLTDFIRNVPGVTMNDFGPGLNEIVIRGVSRSDAGPATGLYLGEIPLTAVGLNNDADIRLVDMERVEVLRGPQGTLFGAGSMGGTLRYIPAAPDTDAVSAKVTADHGQTDHAGENNWGATAMVNVPLVREELALRVVAYQFENGGYVHYVGNSTPNVVTIANATGGYVDHDNNSGALNVSGVRASLLWQASDRFDATITYLYQDLGQSGFQESSVHLRPYQDYPLGFGSLTEDGHESRDIRADVANVLLHYDFGPLDLISSTSRVEFDGGESRDVSRDGFGAIGVVSRHATEATTEELRLSSDFNSPLNFLAGLYYEDNDWSGTTDLPWRGDPSLCCYLGFFGTDPNGIGHVFEGDHTTQHAAFGELYFKPTDHLEFTAGTRFFEYDRTLVKDATGIAYGQGLTTLDGSQSGQTYSASAEYHVTADQMVYARWAQGFRLGVPLSPLPGQCDADNDGILDGTTALIQDVLAPDTLDSVELGTKSAFANRRLAVDLAAYQIDWEGIPLTVVGTCTFSTQVNGGAARIRGIELDTRLALTESLVAYFNAAANDASITQGGVGFGNAGDELPQSPYQLNFGLEYNFALLGRASYVRTDYGYIGGYKGLLDGSGPALGAYGTLALHGGIDLGEVNLEFYATNVTNTVGATYYSAPHRIWHTVPRTVGVRLGWNY